MPGRAGPLYLFASERSKRAERREYCGLRLRRNGCYPLFAELSNSEDRRNRRFRLLVIFGLKKYHLGSINTV